MPSRFPYLTDEWGRRLFFYKLPNTFIVSAGSESLRDLTHSLRTCTQSPARVERQSWTAWRRVYIQGVGGGWHSSPCVKSKSRLLRGKSGNVVSFSCTSGLLFRNILTVCQMRPMKSKLSWRVVDDESVAVVVPAAEGGASWAPEDLRLWGADGGLSVDGEETRQLRPPYRLLLSVSGLRLPAALHKGHEASIKLKSTRQYGHFTQAWRYKCSIWYLIFSV